ncbi:MAG: Copper-ion-binding protein [Candidatus Accumulibacter regalis]|jgi:copper chaperone|uniref:Copper-ion-binding protein n=1 Tax=Accumulibacter regalis TaxID=522306 RepID=A0A011R5J0_ACCRE|nr:MULTISPECIES: heavy-metal-associated domain-containing protein [unclassified Candidatus Accumulibacter]EXI86399.1 MAG: Copper-ion-binding protein [Candidatus Accumulibacter regalis]HRE70344.1 heavy-metal-associated domain-containing protein [Accumulibacter sp.]HRI90462.1 heavy-metal-associated domain-containing protein [Accumulibacter sp.]
MGLTAASNRTGKYDGETAMETICIGVVGMRCQACVKSVSTVLKNLPGVSQVEVSLEASQARITYDPKVASVADFATAIDEAGFANS